MLWRTPPWSIVRYLARNHEASQKPFQLRSASMNRTDLSPSDWGKKHPSYPSHCRVLGWAPRIGDFHPISRRFMEISIPTHWILPQKLLHRWVKHEGVLRFFLGTPNHPFLDGIFDHKPTILELSPFMETPILTLITNIHQHTLW